MTDKLALVSDAKAALNASSELPDNKCITVAELQAMIPDGIEFIDSEDENYTKLNPGIRVLNFSNYTVNLVTASSVNTTTETVLQEIPANSIITFTKGTYLFNQVFCLSKPGNATYQAAAIGFAYQVENKRAHHFNSTGSLAINTKMKIAWSSSYAWTAVNIIVTNTSLQIA